jgi:hypothetical protein
MIVQFIVDGRIKKSCERDLKQEINEPSVFLIRCEFVARLSLGCAPADLITWHKGSHWSVGLWEILYSNRCQLVLRGHRLVRIVRLPQRRCLIRKYEAVPGVSNRPVDPPQTDDVIRTKVLYSYPICPTVSSSNGAYSTQIYPDSTDLELQAGILSTPGRYPLFTMTSKGL